MKLFLSFSAGWTVLTAIPDASPSGRLVNFGRDKRLVYFTKTKIVLIDQETMEFESVRKRKK